ncbi:amino acid permease/ SLC12A domain-containing protein [Cokeromyces recurvatus]|uniref:amino acid permease/ SLC12A domain-containing protein n=1 Tax=Cokeromyces recurvatus TaxID=90255 RepID=UPI002220A152|nr:amino acid permease/ SLC12A domain-containing protein [Cokeromyces recurvatus]KAI7908010.1 amino acid permease/ SLC12A domain-containing protein [Cokeromyces recurvatus]
MNNTKIIKPDLNDSNSTTIEFTESYYSSAPSEVESAIINEKTKLRRGLKARHIQMIALGGTIGTGLFMASGKAISNGGPGGALVAYAIVGLLVFCVMMSLGEMAAYIPVSGSFAHFARRFVDPSLGFMIGWIYWVNWSVGVAVELTGVAMMMEYWVKDVNSVIWSIICLALLVCINVFSVKGYGEIEYWISFIKVLTVIAFVIVGICVDTGAAGGHYIGTSNFHLEGGAIPFGFIGIFNVFITAAFSFNGVEIVGITAGESENPHKTVPAAVKQVFFRIVLFYILSILIIGLIIPYTDPDLLHGSSNVAVSPFTLVFKKAGAAWAADLMNAIILVTMISAGNSGVYSSSRTLLALAEDGSAPSFFKRINRWGIPIWSVLATCAVGCLAFLTSLWGSGVVFNWITAIPSVAGLIVWVSISVTHIRFRMGLKAQGRSLTSLPYVAPFFPFGDIFVVVVGCIVIGGQGYQNFLPPVDVKNCISAYLSVMFCFVLYFGHKLIRRPAFIKASEMDFETGTYKEPALKVSEGEKLSDDIMSVPIWKRALKKVFNIIA